MATYEQTSDNTALWGMGLFMGASIAGGIEGRMQKRTADIAFRYRHAMVSPAKWVGRARAHRVAAGRATEALNMASKYGVFNKNAITRASRAKLLGPMAKLALGRVGSVAMLGLQASWVAPLIYSGVKGVVQSSRAFGLQAKRLEFGTGFDDTKGSYTARQRAVRAITSSRYAARSAIGGEAQLMHR